MGVGVSALLSQQIIVDSNSKYKKYFEDLNEERDSAEIEEHNSSEVLSPQQNSTINDTNNLINNTNNIDENCPQNFLRKKRKSSTKEETKTSDNNQKKKDERTKLLERIDEYRIIAKFVTKALGGNGKLFEFNLTRYEKKIQNCKRTKTE